MPTITETVATPERSVAITPAPPAVSFIEDRAAFTRTYKAARSAWRESHVNPLRAHYNNTSDGILGGNGVDPTHNYFGLEIEFDDGDERLIAEDLYDCGLARSPYRNSYHSGTETEWRFEDDASVSGGEFITPVLSDTAANWNNIETGVGIITQYGGRASQRAGCHVNISVAALRDIDGAFDRLGTLAIKFEDLMYRLAANPYHGKDLTEARGRFIAATHRGTGYAYPLNTRHGNPTNLMNGHAWLSLFRSNSTRSEFRIFDSTLDMALIQTQTKIAAALVRAATNEAHDDLLAEMPDRPRGYHRRAPWRQPAEEGGPRPTRLTGEAWRKDSEAIRQFVDILFTSTEDREQVISLYAMNDWAFSRRRRRY